jgi:hypothetical protein
MTMHEVVLRLDLPARYHAQQFCTAGVAEKLQNLEFGL